MTEPPAAMQEEFNAWYDSEHLAERLAIPGFRSARRWVAEVAAGEGKYLATYELDSPAVLQSAPYRARLEAPTPWTRRCLDRTVLFERWACEQVEPGMADPHPLATAVILIVSDAAALRPLPRVLQTRRFVAVEGEPRHIALAEFAHEPPGELPVREAGTLVRLYRAYAA